MNGLRGLQEELTDRLDMPEDLLLGAERLTVVAGRKLLIENHRGLHKYEPGHIVVALRRGKINILGSGLSIKIMTGRQLFILGRIASIEWE